MAAANGEHELRSVGRQRAGTIARCRIFDAVSAQVKRAFRRGFDNRRYAFRDAPLINLGVEWRLSDRLMSIAARPERDTRGGGDQGRVAAPEIAPTPRGQK